MQLILAHLYPNLMNIYGDQGNIQALKFRCQQRQIKLIIKPIHLNSPLPLGSFDLLFAGGGQDQQQQLISSDLFKRRQVLLQAAQNQIPMLTICGSYQLFGTYFKPFTGPKIKGISIFKAYTIASRQRKIGNIIIKTSWGKLVGFENHSGNTFLQSDTQPLGKVLFGSGNNGQDKTEGAIFNHVFGCYLHGSLLPKNPHFADHLIQLALINKYGPTKLQPLNDQLEWQTHTGAINRTRKLHHPLLKYF
ncbi:MAG: glutamine amidotransferase [Patescibacteria group bacterium]|nr:glutamine amidotransferase [Patescibacteria group bacterium]